MYSIQTDNDGEIEATKSLKKAHSIAKSESAKSKESVYIARTTEQDGDEHVAEYVNGKQVR